VDTGRLGVRVVNVVVGRLGVRADLLGLGDLLGVVTVVGLLGLGLEVTVVLVGLLRLGVVTVVGILFVTLVGRLFIDPGGAWGSV